MLVGMEMVVVLVGLAVGLVLGLALGAVGGVLWVRSRPEHVASVGRGMVDQAEVMQELDRLSDQMRDLEHQRATWQGQLNEQVQSMRSSTELLRRETQSLSTALRRPQVRGRWGELHLRRAVELAGLVDRCDFSEQVRLDDGARRPDLVVHLVGGRTVVVDAKVPLDAHLDATATNDDEERRRHLERHARQLRTHVDQLGAKGYWRSLPETPEFVVLFVPAESFLAAALDADPGLIEHAATRQVVLATPTTLIALLRTVAHGWSHEALAAQAREIHRLGRELHGRLTTFSGHLDGLGRALNSAATTYNQAVGSLESRVLVTARRMGELGGDDAALPSPRPVELRAVERRGGTDGPSGDRSVAG
ncbi:DNA recombination protein RmuC [Nocardioides sp. SYSU D00038]|uniref:DNA recombination protein RmuC n=1 Tax=Nocardioides sp. SYSU D00038 TaxID=2812554 RepID=UPI001966F959|nr:DNA recombination protein RmuC [Nocardioides sp. SYSU D00038]